MGPVRRRALAAPALVVAVALLAVPAAAVAAAQPRAIAYPSRLSVPPEGYLGAVNYYRSASGDAPVTDNSAWSAGIADHLTYLQDTPADLMTGQYASAHTENPASPYYTAAGAQEAASSDLALGGVDNPLDAVEGWMAAPFHAIGILRAQLTQVAFASDAAGFAGLDVISGLDYSQPPAAAPITFPGDGGLSFLDTRSLDELPDPSAPCGAGKWLGLSLIVLLPAADTATATSASLTEPAGTVDAAGGSALCMVTAANWTSPDPVYGPAGGALLSDDHATLLLPAAPLVPGVYHAHVGLSDGTSVDWSFTEEPVFTDVAPTAYYRSAVRWLTANGVTAGVSTTSFQPNAPVLRAQMAAFLYRFAGSPAPAATSTPFTDVPSDAYYGPAVAWLVAQGVTAGTSPTTFTPGAPVTRGQLAEFLYRMAGTPACTVTAVFTDVPAGSPFAAAACWAQQTGVLTGHADGTLGVSQSLTRGQMAAVLQRFNTAQPSGG